MMYRAIGTVAESEMEQILGTELGKRHTEKDVHDLVAMVDEMLDVRNHGKRVDMYPTGNSGLDMRLIQRYHGISIGSMDWLLLYDHGDALLILDRMQDSRFYGYDKTTVAKLKFQREVLAYLLPERDYVPTSKHHTHWVCMGTMITNSDYEPLSSLIMDEGMTEAIREIAEKNDGPGRIARMIVSYMWTKDDDGFAKAVPYGGQGKTWNYLRIVGSGAISYLPKPLEKGDWSNVWNKNSRVQQKCGRFVRAFFTPEQLKENDIGDKEIEAFSIIIQTGLSRALENVYLVSEEDIRYWYDGDNYYHDAGELNSSCMRYEQCQRYMDVYVKNPDTVQMLIMTTDSDDGQASGELMARGIVWTDTEGRKWLDRVYASYKNIPRVYKHAEQEYNIRSLRDDGATIQVRLQDPWHSTYPYMDTLGHLHEEGYLTNYESRSGETVSLHSTGGGPNLKHSNYRCRKCNKMSFKRRNNNGYCPECREEALAGLIAGLGNLKSSLKVLSSEDMDYLWQTKKLIEKRTINHEYYALAISNGMAFQWHEPDRVWKRITKKQFADISRADDIRLRKMEIARKQAVLAKKKTIQSLREGIFPGSFDIVDTLPNGSWEWVGDHVTIRINNADFRVIVALERVVGDPSHPCGYRLTYVRTESYNHGTGEWANADSVLEMQGVAS